MSETLSMRPTGGGGIETQLMPRASLVLKLTVSYPRNPLVPDKLDSWLLCQVSAAGKKRFPLQTSHMRPKQTERLRSLGEGNTGECLSGGPGLLQFRAICRVIRPERLLLHPPYPPLPGHPGVLRNPNIRTHIWRRP